MILICYTFSNLLCFSWMALHSAYVHYNACKKGLQTFRLKSKYSLTLFFCHKLPAQYIPFSMRLTKQRHISVLYSQSPCLFHNSYNHPRILLILTCLKSLANHAIIEISAIKNYSFYFHCLNKILRRTSLPRKSDLFFVHFIHSFHLDFFSLFFFSLTIAMNFPIFYLICQIKVGFMQLVPFTHFLQSFHNLKCQILCFFSFHRLELWIFAFFLCILHNFFSIFLLKTSFFYNFSYVFLCFSDSSFGFIIHLTYAMLLFIITLILYFMKKMQKVIL